MGCSKVWNKKAVTKKESQMNIGDLVKIPSRQRTREGKIGILLNRIYLGYDSKNNQWEVLVMGTVVILSERLLWKM